MQIDSEFDLLGLFQGVGLPFQSESVPEPLPNMIWLYRRPILDYWAEHEESLGAIVTHVLVHEIGHHFGLSDDDMEAIEASALISECAWLIFHGSWQRSIDPNCGTAYETERIQTGVRTMDKFTTLEGVAAPLKIINVDTDMVIPKQYLKTIKRTGLGKGLFSELRYKDDGSENPDFVLNKPAYRKSKILVAGDNFGCGSSREHAPWALMDFGIRCVISTSFGDIFYNNCFKNGVLPIRVSPEDLEKLFDDAERGANATLSIDLEKQEIRGPDGGMVKFEIDAHRKHCMLNGLDDIGLTKQKQSKIVELRGKGQGRAAVGPRPWGGGARARVVP